MPTILSRLWQNIIEAHANYYDFVLWLNEFAVRFFESEFSKGLFGEGASFASVIEKYNLLPYLLMLIGLLETFFGRRFIRIQKLILGFIVGFAVGTVYIAPVVASIIPLDHFVIGLALGVVFAFFRSPLYWIALAGISVYTVYFVLVNHLHFVSALALIVSVAIAVLMFVFLIKWLEYIGTSLLGGWIFAASLSLVVDFDGGAHSTAVIVIALILAAHGVVVQYLLDRHRKKMKKTTA